MAGGKSRKSGGVSRVLINRIVAGDKREKKAEQDKAKGIEKLNPLTIPKPEIPEQWNFHEANKAFNTLIYEWRRLTGDVIGTLWIFYNKLLPHHTHKKGRPIKSENSDLPTWLEWLKSKGISDKTATSNFRKLGWLPPTSDEDEDESAEIIAELKKTFAAELRYLEEDELIALKDNWSDGGKWWNVMFVKVMDVLKKTQQQKHLRQTTINAEKSRKEYNGDILVSFGWPKDATREKRAEVVRETLTFRKITESQKRKWRLSASKND